MAFTNKKVKFTYVETDLILKALFNEINNIRDIIHSSSSEKNEAEKMVFMVKTIESKLKFSDSNLSVDEYAAIFSIILSLHHALKDDLDNNNHTANDRENLLNTIRIAETVLRKLKQHFTGSD